MRVDKAGQNNLSLTVDLDDFLAILLEPGIAEGVFGPADGNDLATLAEHGSVFEDGEVLQIGATSQHMSVRKPQSQELADVDQ